MLICEPWSVLSGLFAAKHRFNHAIPFRRCVRYICFNILNVRYGNVALLSLSLPLSGSKAFTFLLSIYLDFGRITAAKMNECECMAEHLRTICIKGFTSSASHIDAFRRKHRRQFLGYIVTGSCVEAYCV